MAQESSERESVEEYVTRALEEDPAALAFLAKRACQLALRTASAVVSTRGEADDISQDVAIDALRSLSKLRDPAAFDAWVHQIAVRRVGRALRRHKRFRRTETPLAFLPMWAEPEAGMSADSGEQLAMREALEAALATLPERQRLALALRYIHDLSDADIAQALNCREGTVRALLSRARVALQSHEQLSGFTPSPTGGTP